MNHQHTIEQLRSLRLSGMADAFAQQLSDIVFGSLAFEQRLQMLVDAENAQRSTQRYHRILKNAKLKVVAAPEDIDYGQERGLDKSVMADLMTCSWIGRHRNLLMTGATGTGKTWLACALGVQAARQGITVAYRRTARLLEEMAIGHQDETIARQRQQVAKAELLILDDFGLVALSSRGGLICSSCSTIALEPKPPSFSGKCPSRNGTAISTSRPLPTRSWTASFTEA